MISTTKWGIVHWKQQMLIAWIEKLVIIQLTKKAISGAQEDLESSFSIVPQYKVYSNLQMFFFITKYFMFRGYLSYLFYWYSIYKDVSQKQSGIHAMNVDYEGDSCGYIHVYFSCWCSLRCFCLFIQRSFQYLHYVNIRVVRCAYCKNPCLSSWVLCACVEYGEITILVAHQNL